MNFFESDEEVDDIEKAGFYEKSPSASMPVFEQYFNKFVEFLNQYNDKLNEFELKKLVPTYYIQEDALHVSYSNIEANLGVIDAIQPAGNKVLTKLAMVFTALDLEISKIVETFEASLFDSLVIYGENSQEQMQIFAKPHHEGECELQISRMFGVFKEIYELVKRLVILIHNLVNQLHWINNKMDPLYKKFFKENPFNSALETLSKGLGAIVTLDALVKENEDLTNHWNQYKRMLKIVKSDSAKFGMNETQIKSFEKILFKIDQTVLSGNCMNLILSQNFDVENISLVMNFSQVSKDRKSILIKDNKELYSMITNYLKNSFNELNEIIGLSTETNERRKFVQLLGLYTLYRKFFKEEDRNLWKLIWSFQKRMPLIFVHCHIHIILGDFLLNVTPLTNKSNSKNPKDHKEHIRKFLSAIDATFEQETHSLYLHFCAWVSRVESNVASNNWFQNKGNEEYENALNFRMKLLMTGVLLVNQIKNQMMNFIMLHLSEGIEINKLLIKPLCLCIQMLKAIEYLVKTNLKKFHPTIMARLISKSMYEIIKPYIEKIKKSMKGKDKEDNYLSLQLLVKTLGSINSPMRFFILNFSCDLLQSLIKESEMSDFKYLVWKLEIISNYQILIRKATNCDFLYWSQEIIWACFRYFYENPKENSKIDFVLAGINDCVAQIKNSRHLENPETLIKSFKQEILSHFNTGYLNLVARDVEDSLRITIHSILIDKIKGPNPFKIDMKSLKKLLEISPIRIMDISIDLKAEIEKRLDESFYNLNTLNLYDYETYEFIRQLASEQLGIELLNVYIPSQTLEQGAMDILSIIRNIQAFVTKFTYNLYNQTFIELNKDGRMLATVGIQQISDSIKTHGLGIINTNINAVYKFLLKKFNVFSQFLYDDLIQSPLIREDRFFQENRIKLYSFFPFERAENLYKEIKKLGVFEDGNTFMDKFRILITSIGNALGFARLIKSASLHCCSKLIEYVPSLTLSEDLSLQTMAEFANFGNSTKNAVKDLEELAATFKEQFSSQTDYMRMLVKTFENVSQGETHKHLNLFYYIVPPLLMNYIEHILINKEKLIKKTPQDVFLTDDGFPMGVAYFLKALKMDKLYDGLHWEEVVRKKFAVEIKDNTKDSKEASRDLKYSTSKRQVEEINMQKELSLRKVTMQKEEYELLFSALKNARILFSS